MKCEKVRITHIPIESKLAGANLVVDVAALLVGISMDFGLLMLVLLFVVLGLTLGTLINLKNNSDSANMDIKSWCEEMEGPLYRENPCRINYLQKSKKNFNKWLSKQSSFPSFAERKEKFLSFVEIEKGHTSIEMIKAGLEQRASKPAYIRVYEALTNKSSGLR